MHLSMFKNRHHAGELLAEKFQQFRDRDDVVILGIPRGGVVVAAAMAERLELPMDVLVVKKLSFPGNDELAIGAVSSDKFFVFESVSKDYLDREIKEKQAEVRRRLKLFRGSRKMFNVKDKTVILVDDGIATGATMSLAVNLIKQSNPKRIIVAVPVAPVDSFDKIGASIVVLETPLNFFGIGQFYEDFEQVSDERVILILRRAWQRFK